jgi:hypothetical protein
MEHFYQAMLGAMITIASTCTYVARAADAGEPSDPLAWEGWLQPENGLAVTDVVGFGGLRPEGGDDHRTGHFPAARAAGTGVEDLDALARDWLTYWLLDMGRLGRVDFEQWIAGWPRPGFLQMPDLVLPASQLAEIIGEDPVHLAHGAVIGPVLGCPVHAGGRTVLAALRVRRPETIALPSRPRLPESAGQRDTKG